jgi:hypothetical protein
MPGGLYQNMLPALLPPWMRGPNLTTLSEAVGVQFDANAEQVLVGRMQSSVYAGGPTATREGAGRLADGRLIECEPFVLPLHAEQRGIGLYPTESTLSKRIRLSRWRQIHAERGTHRGELRNIAPYFADWTTVPKMRIVHQSNEGTPSTLWHTLDSDGAYSVHRELVSNWDWDGVPVKRSRFWLIIYVDGLGFSSPDWDGGEAWDGGAIWDGTFTAAQISDLVSLVTEAKSAHSTLWGIIAATDPASFDPTAAIVVDGAGWSSLPNGKWGYTIDLTTGLPTRLPTARFLYDLGQG